MANQEDRNKDAVRRHLKRSDCEERFRRLGQRHAGGLCIASSFRVNWAIWLRRSFGMILRRFQQRQLRNSLSARRRRVRAKVSPLKKRMLVQFGGIAGDAR